MAKRENDELWREGTRTWPGLNLDESIFLGFLHSLEARSQEASNSDSTSEAETHETDAEELFLVCSCLHEVPGAHQAFQERYVARARAATSRMNISEAQRADVEQLAYEKLFVAPPGQEPKILDYVGMGNLAALTRVIVVRTAISQLRKLKREVLCDDVALGEISEGIADPGLDLVRSDFKKEFAPAFAASLATLSERDRNFLRLRFVDGLPVEQISRMYQMHRVTASRTLSRIRRSLRDETRSRLRSKLQLTPETLNSFMRLVDSQLDLSIEWSLQSRVDEEQA